MNEEKNVPITLGEKYMLTIREASIYFNIGVKKIRRLAEDNLGVFSIYSGNRYLIIRPKFGNISAEFLRYKLILFAVSS